MYDNMYNVSYKDEILTINKISKLCNKGIIAFGVVSSRKTLSSVYDVVS